MYMRVPAGSWIGKCVGRYSLKSHLLFSGVNSRLLHYKRDKDTYRSRLSELTLCRCNLPGDTASVGSIWDVLENDLSHWLESCIHHIRYHFTVIQCDWFEVCTRARVFGGEFPRDPWRNVAQLESRGVPNGR